MAEIKSYPNNVNVEIGAENVMRWHHGRTSGVYGAEGELVTAALPTPAMAVTVSDGGGWLTDASGNGIHFWIDTFAVTAALLQLPIATADGVLNRIDRVIVEWSTPNYAQLPEIKVLKGTNAVAPVAPALTNNESLRQISLSRIAVAAGTLAITAGKITDERFQPAVCGIVTETVAVDTTMAAAQFDEVLGNAQNLVTQLQGEALIDHASTHEIGGDDIITPAGIGALPYDAVSSSLLIDGGFQIWPEGVIFSNPAALKYTAAMWKLNSYNADGGTFPTIQHIKTESPTEIRGNIYRIVVDGAGSGYGANANYAIRQQIEHGVRNYAGAGGEKVTVSFLARSNIAGKKIGISSLQHYGTGGSPSTEDWLSGANFSLTSAWQRFTHTFTTVTKVGKTFGTAFNDSLFCDIRFLWGTTAAARVGASTAETFVGSGFIDIAEVQFNPGDVPLPFVPRSYADELRLGQRYYIADVGRLCCGYAAGTNFNGLIPTPVMMRANPTVTATSWDNAIVGTAVTAITGYTSATARSNGVQVALTITANIANTTNASTANTNLALDARM